MPRIRFDFGALVLDAALLDTPTAHLVAAALPATASAQTWGDEIYFEVPVEAAREGDARAVVVPGEIAYWPAKLRARPVERLTITSLIMAASAAAASFRRDNVGCARRNRSRGSLFLVPVRPELHAIGAIQPAWWR